MAARRFIGRRGRVCLVVLALLCLPRMAGAAAPCAPLLWEARSADPTERHSGPALAYLFGSLHFGARWMYPLPEHVLTAFEEADVLVVEVDLRALDTRQTRAVVDRYSLLDGGDHIGNHLSPGTWHGMEQAARRLALPISMLGGRKPWFVATVLTAEFLRRLGYREPLGVDRHFLDRAGGKRIIALETMEGQLSMLDRFSGEEAEAFVRETLREIDADTGFFPRLFEAWRCGDAEALRAITATSSNQSPELSRARSALIDGRNRAMAAGIRRQLTAEPAIYFVVLGVGHMVGPGGIPRLLQADGYRVRKVVAPASLDYARHPGRR